MTLNRPRGNDRQRDLFSAARAGGVFLLLAMVASIGRADPLADFRALADTRVAVRTSLGVRRAEASGDAQVRLTLGMSVTGACQRAASYRIVSFQDDNYAYAKFVQPRAASCRTELEIEGPAGCPFARFERTIVTLDLPTPMQAGAEYFVVAQGSQGEVVTGGHTAQGFVFKGPPRPADDAAVHLAVLGLRQLEPVGPKILKLEFGPNFSAKAAGLPHNYTVRVAGKPVKVSRLGRISRIDTYLPTGWPFAAIAMHEVFLELAEPFADGDLVEVEVNRAVTAATNRASLRFNEKQSLTNSIKVNQVGYLVDSPVKQAYLGRWLGSFPEPVEAAEANKEPSPEAVPKAFWEQLQKPAAAKKADGDAAPAQAAGALAFAEPPEFCICREGDLSVAFRGKARLVHRSGEMTEGYYKVDHSGENVYVLDFTSVKTPGRYFVTVPRVGRSLPFEIGEDVYRKAFEVQAYGVFAQRCGIELGPPYSDWRRIACHTAGITLTTQLRDEPHEIRSLADHVVRRALNTKPDPKLDALNRDAAIVAHYPLDGDFKDISGNGHDLLPAWPAQRFSPNKETLPNDNQAFGPTLAAPGCGAIGKAIPADASNGYTICGWFKKDEDSDFHGTLFGFGTGAWGKPKMSVTAGWGVLSICVGSTGRPAQHARINDGVWHHVALVVRPESEKPRQASLFVDGRLACSAEAGTETAADFLLAALTGKGSSNASFDDVRLYRRPLGAAELVTLATPRPAEAPVVIPARGGHHDAGDYNPRSHLDVAQTLMDAYEMAPRKFYDGQLNIPEKGNGVPDILDEAHWALRLWFDLQDADGGVYHGTESAGDPNFVETVELDRVGDYAYAKDAAASYSFAGAAAQASRLWRSVGKAREADDLLARARRAYAWAENHLPRSKTPQQYASGYLGPKAYAAAQLLHTTGEAKFNKDFLDVCVWSRKPDAELDVYGQYDQSLAAWAYVNCPSAAVDPRVQQAVRRAIVARADWFIGQCQTMAYQFIRHPMAPINWGTGAYENSLPVVLWSYKLTGDEKYRAWIVRTCDNTLGANPLNRSYVVGLGTRTVRAPLHNSRYSHLGEVVWGQQVEGPVQSANGYRVAEIAYPPVRENFASLQTFVDSHFAIDMDEGVVTSQAKTMAAFGLLLRDRE
ncbi:MAG: glycoside hydrolase family 9 protein [Pirellulales bacterium]